MYQIMQNMIGGGWGWYGACMLVGAIVIILVIIVLILLIIWLTKHIKSKK